MRHILAGAAFVVALGTMPVFAVSPLPLAKPEAESALEFVHVEGESDAMDLTIDLSVAEDENIPVSPPLEPSAPSVDWDQESQSGVAFPVSEALSLGVDYEIEETEDLAANGIGLGTANEDRESHNVMIRANIQFDLELKP